MFEITDLFRPIAEVNFIETASPPASSAGLEIFCPLDSRVKLCCSLELFLLSENAALFAAVFDSIDKAIFTNSFLLWFRVSYPSSISAVFCDALA